MLNDVTIMGRLTGEPELRNANDTPVASFAIACERDFKNKSGERETDFFNCTAWRKTGEFIAKNFNKGDMIAIRGRLQRNDFTDKEGNKRQNVVIVVDSAYFASSKKDKAEKPDTYDESQLDDELQCPDDDEMPF